MNTNGDTDKVGPYYNAYPTPQHHYILFAYCMLTNGFAITAGVVNYVPSYTMPFSYHYNANITMTFGFAKWLLTIAPKRINKQATILLTLIVHQPH